MKNKRAQNKSVLTDAGAMMLAAQAYACCFLT